MVVVLLVGRSPPPASAPLRSPRMAMGRPSELWSVLETRSGAEITVADAIEHAVRAGNYLEVACDLAAVDKSTVRGWLRDGARLAKAVEKGERRLSRLTRYERAALDFGHAVRRAMAESEARDVTTLAEMARGGRQITKTYEEHVRDDGGEMVLHRRRETVEELAPDVRAIVVRLERRFPSRWSAAARMEVTGPGGGPLEVETTSATDRLIGAITAMARRQAETADALAALEEGTEAIDTTATEGSFPG